MDRYYEDLNRFFKEQTRKNDKYIELQKQIDKKMSRYAQNRFYNLLWHFDNENRTAFVCNLWNVVCRNDITDSWMVFKHESEEIYNTSVELIDLIDGWLCECVADHDNEALFLIKWTLHRIKED